MSVGFSPGMQQVFIQSSDVDESIATIGLVHDGRQFCDFHYVHVDASDFVQPRVVSLEKVCGGDPCLTGTRIPVWVLEKFRQYGVADEQLLEMYPSLHQADLNVAWKFVETHRAEIEQRIAENEGWHKASDFTQTSIYPIS